MTILKQPSDQIIVDQLNKDNNVSLTLAQVKLGTPDQVPNPTHGNTNLPILAKPGGGYVGSVLGNYNRFKLDDLFGFKVVLLVQDFNSVSDVLTAFNNRYGTGLALSEIVNAPVNPNNVDQNGNIIYTIIANNSRVYTGQVTVAIVGIPPNAILSEDGFALTTEDGNYLTQ